MSPPAYTEWIGRQLLASIEARRMKGLLTVVLLIAACLSPSAGDAQGTRHSADRDSLGLPPVAAGAPRSDADVSQVAGNTGRPESVAATAPLLPDTGLQVGYATWCAPTATKCHGWGGRARLGAVHGFRWGDTPYRARVCRADAPVCTTVTIVSFCGCGDRKGKPTLVDLTRFSFSRLELPSRGVVLVTIEPLPLAPRTDVEP